MFSEDIFKVKDDGKNSLRVIVVLELLAKIEKINGEQILKLKHYLIYTERMRAAAVL